MDGEEQKICPNCKREIPAVNFTIHTVHCARNIKMCPVCKEPVPQADLEDHHEKLHKLLPCKQCGEKVCGTDLEDHIRDSCGHTIKSCRYCDLELRRRELPAHEGYCGVRTEQCPECREWVMIKYRQLHLDSNHGFLRLDDDPVPQPKKDPPKISNLLSAANVPRPSTAGVQRPNVSPSNSNLLKLNTQISSNQPVKNTNLLSEGPRTEIRFFNNPSSSRVSFQDEPSASRSCNISARDNLRDTPNVFRSSDSEIGDFSASVSPQSNSNVLNGVTRIPHKRTNDKPQINTSAVNKHVKDKAPPLGAVKKRPAPRPPAATPPPPDPRRERALRCAVERQQAEERQRNEQNAYNLAHGLPPVLSPAAKLEKLRKMDALHNRESEPVDYKNILQGRVWMNNLDVPIGNVLGSNTNEEPDFAHLEVEMRRRNKNRSGNFDNGDVRDEFRDVKPMTPEQFIDRFKELQAREENVNSNERRGDRFSEIKSSLRELRRGLNEVTAPYNSNNVNAPNNSDRPRRVSPVRSSGLGDESEVRLPCEFCGAPVPAHDLVLHQTGCRPDLAQYRESGRCEPQSEAAAVPVSVPVPVPYGGPVIPCEFCTESLPVYLIVDHQERCGREANLLYPD